MSNNLKISINLNEFGNFSYSVEVNNDIEAFGTSEMLEQTFNKVLDYCQFYMKENLKVENIPEPEDRKDVHTEHCCFVCGCKYGSLPPFNEEDFIECSVVSGRKRQTKSCDGKCSFHF